jgi:hypothetical protein
MAKAKKTTKKKEIKEEIELRVEDYLTMGEDVEILSVEDTIEEKFGELVPVLEQRLKEHTKFLIEKQKHVDEINNSAEISESKAEIKLLGEKAYLLQSASDGFLINDAESGKNFFSINKTGSVAFGTRSPRGYGPGSVHIRSNYPSEAPIPATGLHSTRGLIVESDGDDEKTFAFRTLSRQNRQGFNITGDGRLLWGAVTDTNNSRMFIEHNENDTSVISSYVPSKYFSESIIDLKTRSAESTSYNFISAKANVEDNNTTGAGTEVFRVDGEGNSYTDGEFFANGSGYTELFEWEDGNPREEIRNGFTVALNRRGQIRLATESDNIIGVVVAKGAVVGNSGWNQWQEKFHKDNLQYGKRQYKVVEWTDEVNVLHSYFEDALPEEFALPENAIVFETDDMGRDMFTRIYNNSWELNREYTNRITRGFARVAYLGQTALYKGQCVDPRWIKIKDLNDEVELWLLK